MRADADADADDVDDEAEAADDELFCLVGLERLVGDAEDDADAADSADVDAVDDDDTCWFIRRVEEHRTTGLSPLLLLVSPMDASIVGPPIKRRLLPTTIMVDI
jgi:hypothetical protein